MAATLFMAGVAWFVQVVHYPLFARVGRDGFTAYEAAHRRRAGLVVGAPMLVEALTAAGLVLRPPEGVPAVATWVGLALVLVAAGSTTALQVPEHRRLERGFDPASLRRLVATSWVRTAAWTSRAVLVLAMAAAADGG